LIAAFQQVLLSTMPGVLVHPLLFATAVSTIYLQKCRGAIKKGLACVANSFARGPDAALTAFVCTTQDRQFPWHAKGTFISNQEDTWF
jgi:hypothetical protein